MMIKIEGLDKMQRQISEAKQAISKLECDSVDVHFDPHDAASIEAAIQQAIGLIDQRMYIYAANPFVAPLIAQFKEACRNRILERAAKARLQAEAK
jgi:hypothetical protein